MINKKSSPSSKRWLQKHFSDQYVQRTYKAGLRSRSWFKLDEIQKSDQVFKPGMTIIDLGIAPGGWSQYILSQIDSNCRIIGCDLLPIKPIFGVDFLQGDFRDELVFNAILDRVRNNKVQVVMSDMAPNICGISTIDMPRVLFLVEQTLRMCLNVLGPSGSIIVKIFQGEGFEEYLKKVSFFFKKVKIRKPNSSRAYSRETYIVAQGRK